MAQIWWFVRDANMPAAKETFDKLTKIGEGAALMTGTTMEFRIDAAAWPQLSLKSIADTFQANIDTVGMPKWSEEEQGFAREFQKRCGREADRTKYERDAAWSAAAGSCVGRQR